jgi:competence ComEA-like helix-hairpin-helix protein
VLTTAFGAGLGALGARRRGRLEGPQPQAQPDADAPIVDTPWTRIVDLNQGSIDELVRLPVVGRRAAERIVAHRTEHGPFAAVEELTRVEGFTPSRVAQLAPRATVQEA